MRVLFDKSVPNGLTKHFQAHTVSTVEERGWGRLENGSLLLAAVAAGFEVFLTADKNLRYQQNLTDRKLANVILGNSAWPLVQLHVPAILAAVEAATPGGFIEVDIPLPPKRPFPNA